MPLRETAPKLDPEQYERNFADIKPAMSPRQAAVEAARCLYCFDAPCTIACPTHIDVPAFIKKIYTDNLRGSARVILSANILGESCGRVCPTEVLCEGACVMHEKGQAPIEIGRRNATPLITFAIGRYSSSGPALRTASAWAASAQGPHPWLALRNWRSGAMRLRFSTLTNSPAA